MSDKGLKVKATPFFKLKDRNQRNIQHVNFKKEFGFSPDIIFIEKMQGKNNVVRVVVALTEAEIKKENAMKVSNRKKIEKLSKPDGNS